MEWVSVLDKLPPEDQPILIYDSSHSEAYGSCGYCIFLVKGSDANGLHGECACYAPVYRGSIQYWMPLPHKPKETK